MCHGNDHEVSLERIAVTHRMRSDAAGSVGNGHENEYECALGAARVPQETGVIDSRVNVGDGRGSHDGNVNRPGSSLAVIMHEVGRLRPLRPSEASIDGQAGSGAPLLTVVSSTRGL